METSYDLLPTCLYIKDFRFDAKLCSTWETKILMRAILNVSRAEFGPRAAGFPTPVPDHYLKQTI